MFSRGQTDAFFIAFLIPNMLRQLLAEGASQNAVLPVLSAVREKHGDAGAAETMRSLRGLSLIILTLTSLLGWIFAWSTSSPTAFVLSRVSTREPLR